MTLQRHRIWAILTLVLAGLVLPFGATANAGTSSTTVADPAQPGPYQVERMPAQGNDAYAGGTIYVPRNAPAPLGAIVVAPGFTEPEFLISWYGPQLASHGVAVITINTRTPLDFPPMRGEQMLAALDYLAQDSPVASRIDPTRLAVAGHSMGGGGTLSAAKARPSLKAAIPLAPWHTAENSNWSGVRVPTLIVGAEADFIAPVGLHAEPFYQSLPANVPKAYLEMRGEDHFVTNAHTPEIARQVTSWVKVFVDGDTEYEQYLCPPPQPNNAISEYRSNCPY
jgi:acetyl esterase/lipase